MKNQLTIKRAIYKQPRKSCFSYSNLSILFKKIIKHEPIQKNTPKGIERLRYDESTTYRQESVNFSNKIRL